MGQTVMDSAVGIKVIETVSAMREWVKERRTDNSIIGFVPTMGALHEGHVSLIRQAVKDCTHVVVSIFVNPLQFGPHEDYQKYPRTFERDLELCRSAGAALIFHPEVKELYPAGSAEQTVVVPPAKLTDTLCGAFRPGHFTGVATVVLKLFELVRPHQAYFGEKDFQQLKVIEKISGDLNLPIEIIPGKTIREADGLAMSSRNAYLTAGQRQIAPKLYQSLCRIRDLRVPDKAELEKAIEKEKSLLSADFTVQYLNVCNAQTLEEADAIGPGSVVLVAAKLGNVRLIDNVIVD